MEDLRLASDVWDAAKLFSKREGSDVFVGAVDGSAMVFRDGEEIQSASAYLASPMPVQEVGQPAALTDMTPHAVRLGKWSDELGRFIASRGPMSVAEFLKLSVMSARSAGHA